PAKSQPAPEPVSQKEERKLSYAEQREHEKLVRKARKKVEEAEAEIARLEGEVKAIEEKFAAGETSDALYTAHASATKNLENAMSVWELASMELEEIS
ncbi:MAG: ABC transporter ATP-binding protein, partial [Duncaniella sp.]|nr:ABC transporter ATP-binding protein [Duncaniella sp.]